MLMQYLKDKLEFLRARTPLELTIPRRNTGTRVSYKKPFGSITFASQDLSKEET